jgi:hypothetical protein
LTDNLAVQITAMKPYPISKWNPAPGGYNWKNCAVPPTGGATTLKCATFTLPVTASGAFRYVYWVAHAGACK